MSKINFSALARKLADATAEVQRINAAIKGLQAIDVNPQAAAAQAAQQALADIKAARQLGESSQAEEDAAASRLADAMAAAQRAQAEAGTVQLTRDSLGRRLAGAREAQQQAQQALHAAQLEWSRRSCSKPIPSTWSTPRLLLLRCSACRPSQVT